MASYHQDTLSMSKCWPLASGSICWLKADDCIYSQTIIFLNGLLCPDWPTASGLNQQHPTGCAHNNMALYFTDVWAGEFTWVTWWTWMCYRSERPIKSSKSSSGPTCLSACVATGDKLSSHKLAMEQRYHKDINGGITPNFLPAQPPLLATIVICPLCSLCCQYILMLTPHDHYQITIINNTNSTCKCIGVNTKNNPSVKVSHNTPPSSSSSESLLPQTLTLDSR